MKVCKQCEVSFVVSETDKEFYKKLTMKFVDRIFKIPEPTLCPKCRMQRRMAWRNDRKLYQRVCDMSGKNLISMFAPDSEMKVIDRDIWWSDKYDGRQYGRDFDFSRSFFEQFQELMKEAPILHNMVANSKNSRYSNYVYANKNCYLCFAGNYLEDSLYCYNGQNSRDCVDALYLYDSELCYECIHSTNCYGSNFLLNCRSCKSSSFLGDCVNCSDCFMCFGLTNAQYCILNKQYSKEEYERKMSEIDLGNRKILNEMISQWKTELSNYESKENHNIGAENCSGEYILNSKSCHDCYIIGKGCEDLRYVINAFPRLKDAMDCTYSGEDSSLLYECMASGMECYNLLFCNLGVISASNLTYCNVTFSSKNCFGCSSLRGAEYCILNKQYSKEEYEELVPKIIEHMQKTGEWGEFFPARISPFGYNETLSMEYFPITKEQCESQGLRWRDEVSLSHEGVELHEGRYDILDVSDEVLNSALRCLCGKKYKITSRELDYYRKMRLALPDKCFDCRHIRRLKMRSPAFI